MRAAAVLRAAACPTSVAAPRYGLRPCFFEITPIMINSKETGVKNSYVKMRPAVTETLMGLPKDKPVMFDCREFTELANVRVSVTRLNQRAEWEEFKVTSNDNGATYEVIRRSRRLEKWEDGL